MCPACLANAAVVAGSVMSTGGVAAFAVKLIRTNKRRPADDSENESERSNDHADDKQ